MPIRDLIAAAIVFGFLPLCFRNPFIGLLVFTWLAYMRVQDLCWSFAREMRFSYIVGIVMIAGFICNERKRPFLRIDTRTTCMLALLVLVFLSTVYGYRTDEYPWKRYMEFAKIILIALFTTGLVDSKRRLDLLIITIALSLGFFGFKGGAFGLLSGGSAILRGPGGMMEDNNDFALALVIAVPFMIHLGLVETRKWWRRGYFTAALLTCITILLTHSRGGFLALFATLGLIAWRSKRRWQAFGLALGTVLLFVLFAPAHVKDRIYTIRTYQQDSSAMGRIFAWRASMRMVILHPILGVGMRSFQDAWLTRPETWGNDGPPTGEARVAHNSYLQIWAESGTPAFIFYLVLIASSFFALRRIHRLARYGRAPPWAENYALMFEASLFGFVVGGIFLNRGHFDLLYQIIAIVSALVLISRQSQVQVSTDTVPGKPVALDLPPDGKPDWPGAPAVDGGFKT